VLIVLAILEVAVEMVLEVVLVAWVVVEVFTAKQGLVSDHGEGWHGSGLLTATMERRKSAKGRKLGDPFRTRMNFMALVRKQSLIIGKLRAF